MESSPKYIKPRDKRSVHVGINKYADVQMSDLKQARKDAQKLNDLCKLKENEFDNTVKITDYSLSYDLIYPKIIKSLNDLIIQSEGNAQKDPPQYTFNFISFSCHGVMVDNQTFAIIPLYNEKTKAFEKQYINIKEYAKKLACVKNTYSIILCDLCRNVIKNEDLVIREEEKGTIQARSKENLLKAVNEKSGPKTYTGFTVVIYSTQKGDLSSEEAEVGGKGTKKFLEQIEESIRNQRYSWDFIDSYDTYEMKVLAINRKEWKQIVMFSKCDPKQLSQVQPSVIQAQPEEEKSGSQVASTLALDNDNEVLKRLDDQKDALLKQLKEKWFFQSQFSIIIGFLNNLVSKITFTDPKDDFEAYVDSISGKLGSQEFLPSINEAFDWIFTHMDKAKGFKKIYLKLAQIKMTAEFKDKGHYNWTIIKANNGKVIQGGRDDNLYVLDIDLKHQQTINISDWLSSGMAIGNRLFCGQLGNKVTVFDEDTLALIQTINTQAQVKTMLLIQDDYLLIGQCEGYIDIIQISTLSIIFKHQLSQQATHVIKTSNLNEYAIALWNKGIVIVNISRDGNNKFTLIENTTEYYFQDEIVLQIAEVQSQILIACVRDMKDLQVIDRKSKQVVTTIPNASIDGYYNCLQKVIGYDDETFPFLLLKDQHKISVIDAKKYTAVDIIESQYDASGRPCSMVQYQVNNELRLLTLYSNEETKARSIKEFVIGSL